MDLYYKDRCKLYIQIIGLFTPITFIEIIHFGQSLFSYFIDHTITKPEFIIILCILNIPKLIFFVHMIKKWKWSDPEPGCFIHISMFVIIMFVSITLPLVPYVLLMLHQYSIKEEADNKKTFNVYIFNIISYLWLSYGGSLLFMYYCVSFDMESISYPVAASSALIMVNIIFITLAIPYLSRSVRNANVTGIPHNLNIKFSCC